MTASDAVRKPLDFLAASLAQERAARIRGHRPWPAPDRPWVMAQTWMDLLFAHWSLDPSVIERAVPPQLSLDTFDGAAWVGVTPFEVRNLRLRPIFVPLLPAFPEINVRTYVTFGGKPGIFFFSLDALSPTAVAAARRLYRLPYFRARMTLERVNRNIRYESERRATAQAPIAAFEANYGPTGAPYSATPGTLEHWLTERYCLYTLDESQRVLRGEIHHPPWHLQRAHADIALNTMGAELAVDLRGEPLLHYAARQDVAFWSLAPAG